MQEYIVGAPLTSDDIFARPPRALARKPPAPPDPAVDDLFTVHTHACATCGAEYQTCNPKSGGRCSRCLINKTDAPAASASARITCRVCGAQATVGIAHPALLCEPCLEDLDATRARVQAWLESALRRLDENKAQWDADRAANPAGDKWPTIQAALIAVGERRATPQALAATWAKRKAEGGALARLLKNYELYAEECDRLAEELERCHQAQTQINAAFLATEL